MKVVSPLVLQPLTSQLESHLPLLPKCFCFLQVIRVSPPKTGDLADGENASTSSCYKAQRGKHA